MNKTIANSYLSPSLTQNNEIRTKYIFLFYSIPIAISYWFLDSLIHYFWYHEVEFEIIPTDRNHLWMRICIFILLAAYGLFADIFFKKIITRDIIISQTENISRAKKQWELAVDLLPQLVIGIDINEKIIRANKTIENWDICKVNTINGTHVSELFEFFNDNRHDNKWNFDWTNTWKLIENKDLVESRIENKNTGKIYFLSLRKNPDFNTIKDQCYAVLVIDDITTREDIEKTQIIYSKNLEYKIKERTKELKQTNKQLQQELKIQEAARNELKISQKSRLNLLRGMFFVQENERKRIAGELHDSIGQSLGSTKFKIEEILINKENLNDYESQQLNNLVVIIKSSIDEVRHIAMDLRPAILDDLGIIATIKWFCREFEKTYSSINIITLINSDEVAISDINKVIIFRIIQEALNNVAKHANASKVVIELITSVSEMSLCITDNGNGFDKNQNKPQDENSQLKCSFGLSSMRERAESTKGIFSIDSTPGKGTSIIVSWYY